MNNVSDLSDERDELRIRDVHSTIQIIDMTLYFQIKLLDSQQNNERIRTGSRAQSRA